MNLYAMFAAAIKPATASGARAFGLHESPEAERALKDGDYCAFMTAIPKGMASRMSEEMFDRISEGYQNMEAVRAAIRNGNYLEWVEAIEAAQPPGIRELMTEESFDAFVETYGVAKNGEHELAQKLAESLGTERPFGHRVFRVPAGGDHMPC